MMRLSGDVHGGDEAVHGGDLELDPLLMRELQECQGWIEAVTGEQFGRKDFHAALEDGTLLCKLMQKIQPGSIKKINNLPTPYAKLDNLNLFLRACLDLGLTRNQLFDPSDLTDLRTKDRRDPQEERSRLKNVAITLYWLGKTSEEIPSFPGPYLNRDAFHNVNIQPSYSAPDVFGSSSSHPDEHVFSYRHRPQDSIDSTISQDSSSSVERGQLSGSLDSDDALEPRARMADDMMSRRAAGYLPRPLKKRISESHMFLPPKGGFLSKSNPELNKTYPMGRRKSSGGEEENQEENKQVESLTYDDYKKEKSKLNEDSEMWRSTLDTWKLRRKSKSSADLWAKKEEWQKEEVAEVDSAAKRKSKTYKEIVEEKGGPDIGDVAIEMLRRKRERELPDEYASALEERERAENDNVFNGEDSQPERSWRPRPQPRNVHREDIWSDEEQPTRNVPTHKRVPSPPPRQDSIPKASPAKPSWQKSEPPWQKSQTSEPSWKKPQPSEPPRQRPQPFKPSRDLSEDNKENSESVSNIRSMWQRMEEEESQPRGSRGKFEPPQPIRSRDSPPQPIRSRHSPPAQPIRTRGSPQPIRAQDGLSAQPIRGRDSPPAQPIRASPFSRMTAKQKMEEVANRPVRWEYKDGYMVTNINLTKSQDERGFGFAVSGGKDDRAPVLISSVVPGGSAAKSQLQLGDEILAINEEDVSPFNHNTVVAAIRDSAKTGIISLYVRRKGSEQNAFASLAKDIQANDSSQADGEDEDEPASPAPPPRPPPPVVESPVVRQEKQRVDQTALSQQINRLEDAVEEEPVTRAVKVGDDGSLAERIEQLDRTDRSGEKLDRTGRGEGAWQSKEWRVDPPAQHVEISLLKDEPEMQPPSDVVLRRKKTESELASQNLKRRSDFFLGVDAGPEKPPAEVEKLQSKLTSYTPPQIETGYKPLETRPRSYNLEDERNRLAEWQRSQEERQREQFQKQQQLFKVDYENRLKKSIERKKSDPALLYAPKPWGSVRPPVPKPAKPSSDEDGESSTLQDVGSWEQQQLQLREQQRRTVEDEQQRKFQEEQQRKFQEEEQQRKFQEEQLRRGAEEQQRQEEEQQRRWEEEQQKKKEEEQQRRLEEEQRRKEEEEQQRRWEEQQRKLAEEQRRQEEEEQQRRWEEEQQRKLAEEQQRKEEEEQQRMWEEEQKRRQEEEDRRRWEEEEEERRQEEERARARMADQHLHKNGDPGLPEADDRFYYDQQRPPAEAPGRRWDDEAEQRMLQEEEEFMREQEEMRQQAELDRQKREDERRRIEEHRLEIENQRARLQQASLDHSEPPARPSPPAAYVPSPPTVRRHSPQPAYQPSPPAVRRPSPQPAYQPSPPAVRRPSPQPRHPDGPDEEWDAEEERARIEAAAKQHQRLMEEEERRRRLRRAEEMESRRREEEEERRREEETRPIPDLRPLPQEPHADRVMTDNPPHWLIEEAERRRLQDQTGQPRAPGIIEPLPPLEKPRPKNRHSVHGPPSHPPPGPPTHPPPDVPRRTHPELRPEDVQQRLINRRSAPPERAPQGPIPDHIKDALTQRATRPHHSPPARPTGGGKSVSGRKLCTHCGEPLGRGAAMIIESLALFYHISCFRCSVCGIQLGNGRQGTDVRIRANALHCSNCYSNEKGSGAGSALPSAHSGSGAGSALSAPSSD